MLIFFFTFFAPIFFLKFFAPNNILKIHSKYTKLQIQHYPLPDLPQPLHSSSALYIDALRCLVNIGGDDFNGDPLRQTSVLLMDDTVQRDDELKWNEMYFPDLNIKRSYRPSLGLYEDQQTVLLFVAGGCNVGYDGLKAVESLRLNPWLDRRGDEEIEIMNEDDDWKSKWTKQRNLCVARRDASSLLHWKGINAMVCCGGDHGEGTPRANAVLPWRSSERFDIDKSKWIRLPDFPGDSSHAQNPFIWIEGGVKDYNHWSGVRDTALFEKYGSFDSSTGVLCIIGNGFCSGELGIISFYDPRTAAWQCGGNTEDKWLGMEANYLGLLEETQEVRNICGAVRP